VFLGVRTGVAVSTWDTATGKNRLRSSWFGHASAYLVSFGPNSKTMAIALADHTEKGKYTVTVWDIPDGKAADE